MGARKRAHRVSAGAAKDEAARASPGPRTGRAMDGTRMQPNAPRLRQPLIRPRIRIPLIMMAPAVVIMVGVGIFPLLYSLRLMFTKWTMSTDPAPVWNGLGTIGRLFHDARLANSLLVTAQFTVGAVLLEMVLGLLLALLLTRRTRFIQLARTILLIPMMMTPVVVGMFWRFILNGDFGIVKYVLSLVGITAPVWTGSVQWAMPTVIAIDAWQWTPFVFLILLAGLESLPTDVMEAARVDGATAWSRFWLITFPMLLPFVFISALLRFIDAFRAFDNVFILTGGGPADSTNLASLYVYWHGLRFFDMAYASTLSYVVVMIVLVASYVFIRLERND